MANCKQCCNNACFTIMTILTLGIITAVFSILMYYECHYQMKSVNKTTFYVVLSALIVSALTLIFAIYASCCGKTCAKTTISIIYIIFALAIIGIGIIFLAFQSTIKDGMYKIWNGSLDQQTVKEFEKLFKCHTWDSPFEETTHTCKYFTDNKLSKYLMYAGIFTICLGVILLISVIAALSVFCVNGKHESDSMSQFDRLLGSNDTY